MAQVTSVTLSSGGDPQQGYLDAILAEPYNDAHRFGYADWLDQQGKTERARKFRALPDTAALWSGSWGQDRHGLWCYLHLRTLRQCFRWIPPGSFLMGSPIDEDDRFEDEGPRHCVELSQGFWLSDTPCIQELWTEIMGSNPSRFSGHRRPVENVSWEECQDFFSGINQQVTGLRLRFPTEAQWERACRAGSDNPSYCRELNTIAWYQANSIETHEVKQKVPNPWGLYDTLGNVWEWCHDGMRPYQDQRSVDPTGPTESGGQRVIRGGCWRYDARFARAACRLTEAPSFRSRFIGFRCVSGD